MSTDTLPWIDLSAYGLTLHAVRLPSGRMVLVAAGVTTPHLAALAALGFHRTRQGHIVHPETKLTLNSVRAQFPHARVETMVRTNVVRIVPAPPRSPESLSEVDDPDHWIHQAIWLGVNRRGQAVYKDATDHRFLRGPAAVDFGPETASDFLRVRTPAELPDSLLGLVRRAERGEYLTADALTQLAQVIETPGPDGWRAGGFAAHGLQEALEVAAVRVLRAAPTLASGQVGQADDPLPTAAFATAVHLATHLPPANQRTERTLAWAQFSTPLPLAVATRTLLGPLGAGRSLLEPTAGHGALLLGLPADTQVTAVEIDPHRVERLTQVLGATAQVVQSDILTFARTDQPYDYVLANPPYGALKKHQTTGGSRALLRVGEVSFATQRLDQLILLKTLQQRHPLGRAVYLIAAEHPRDHDVAIPAGGSRYLLNLLGDHYHVEAVLGLHGDLYRAQGAGYPLRLLVIGERGAGFPPVPERIPVVRTWDELWTHVRALVPRIGPSALERATPLAAVTVSTVATQGEAAGETTPLHGVPTDPAADPGAASAARHALPSSEDEFNAAIVYQTRYVARSQIGAATTQVPANMAAAISRALDRVELVCGGSLDDYVARELGHDPARLGEVFAPEQVDALALVFHAQDRGRGFIEADETGIGKGRVLAGAALRAWRQGQLVIFLTEKPNLFSDFYRDLKHLGVRENVNPFILNAGVPLIDTEHGHRLRAGASAKDIHAIVQSEHLPMGVNLVMATYSQLCLAHSAKAAWLCRIAERTGALVIVDESHNATGESNTFANIRRLIEASGYPPLYSSATYAKRPDSWALYAATLPALFRNDNLSEMLRNGGAPLQEVFSQMLAEDGVLIRREHDLSNITFTNLPDTARVEHNRVLADQLASILEKLAWLGGDIETLISEENQRMNEALDHDDHTDRKGNRAGLQSMNFGSRLYQLNRLFLLALKVDHAIEFGTRELEAGRKPIFVVENTLEVLLKEIITNRFGEPATTDAETAEATDPLITTQDYPVMTYRDALHRVLARMMVLTERDGYGNTRQRPVTQPELIALAQAIERDIDTFPDLPLSPLDSVRLALTERGYRIGELSGRNFQADWVERADTRLMRVRPRPAENRADLIYRFNTDVYQGLIMTRSGSTGLSAHARDDVPGWSPAPRTLFELQIPQNVAERIQFWGRVNRRGQCCAPTVVTPSSELPGEVRLIAMQNAKLRKLSANTTSNQDNAALARHIPDLLNPIGNQIARRWVSQNPVDAARLDAEISESRDALPDWYVNRVLSRIMLFPVSEQERLLEEWAGLYHAHIHELKSQGVQPLRTVEFAWQSREVHRATFEETPAVAQDGESPFHAPVDFITVEYEQARDPLRGEDVRRAVALSETAWKAEETVRAFQQVKAEKLALSLRPHGRYEGFASVEAGLQDPAPNRVKRTVEALARIECFLVDARIGGVIEWVVPPVKAATDDGAAADNAAALGAAAEGERRQGVLVAIRPPPRDTLHLAGHYQVVLACPGDERFSTVSLSTLQQGPLRLDPPDVPYETLLHRFDAVVGGTRTCRHNLLVGNLYAALQLAERHRLGGPVIYTTETGSRERGVLLHADVDLALLRAQPVLLRTAEHLRRFVDEHRGECTTLVSSGTGGRPERYKRGIDFILTLRDDEVVLTIPGAHGRNAALIHDPRWQALDITLEGTRTVLTGVIPDDRVDPALAVLGTLHTWYAASRYRDWYNEAVNDDDRRTAPTLPAVQPTPRWDGACQPMSGGITP